MAEGAPGRDWSYVDTGSKHAADMGRGSVGSYTDLSKQQMAWVDHSFVASSQRELESWVGHEEKTVEVLVAVDRRMRWRLIWTATLPNGGPS